MISYGSCNYANWYSNPEGIVIDPNTRMVYVANSGSDTVSVINETTDEVVENVQVGSNPSGIAIDPNTHKVYISCGNSIRVCVMNENNFDISILYITTAKLGSTS